MSSSTIEHQSAVRILPIRRSDQIKEATLLTTLAVGLILALGAVLGISMGGVNAYAGFGLLIAAPLLIGDIFLTRSLLHSYGNRQLSQQEVDRLNIDPSIINKLEPGQYWEEDQVLVIKNNEGSTGAYAFRQQEDKDAIKAHYSNGKSAFEEAITYTQRYAESVIGTEFASQTVKHNEYRKQDFPERMIYALRLKDQVYYFKCPYRRQIEIGERVDRDKIDAALSLKAAREFCYMPTVPSYWSFESPVQAEGLTLYVVCLKHSTRVVEHAYFSDEQSRDTFLETLTSYDDAKAYWNQDLDRYPSDWAAQHVPDSLLQKTIVEGVYYLGECTDTSACFEIYALCTAAGSHYFRSLEARQAYITQHHPNEISCLADGSCSPEWIARNVSTHSPAQLHDDQHRTGTLQVNSLPVFWVTYKQTDKEQTTLYFPDVRDRAQFMRAHLLKSVDLDQLDCLVFPGIPLSDGQIRYGTLPTIGKRQVYFWYAWKTPDKPIQTSIVSPHPTSRPAYYLPHVNYWNLAPLDRELNAFRKREQLDQKLTAKNQCWPATINGTPLLFVHNGKKIVVKKGHNTDGLENVKPSTPPPST